MLKSHTKNRVFPHSIPLQGMDILCKVRCEDPLNSVIFTLNLKNHFITVFGLCNSLIQESVLDSRSMKNHLILHFKGVNFMCVNDIAIKQ